ncbi:hypothetical protein G9A89_022582 [Geosiphon pyriformis]|nr:hypothetical protein G9A89_022582 [Geosiphon pyriformis]
MAYALIAKLDKFNGEEDNAQVWLNDVAKAITANNWDNARAIQVIPYFLQNTTDAWYQSLAIKPQNFNGFKTEFLWYFSNNNSINKLTNIFTTIKQGNTKVVTTYLGCFHRNLHQIQAIQADYFIVPQILNQFIRGLHSSILQQIHPMYPVDFSTAVIYARDFETAELKTNYAQAVNLAMNRSSELDFKLKQFSDSINQKLEEYLTDNHTIYQSSQWHNNQGNANCFQNQSHPLLSSNQSWQPETRICHNYDSEPSTKSRPIPIHLPAYDVPTNLSTTSLSNSSLSTAATSNLSGAATMTPEDATFSNQGIKQQQPLTNNILPATITENESLNAIFPFELKKPSNAPLFNGAALEKKPITAMYTDAKVNGHSIKLILDSGSADSIITQQLMDQLGCQVDRTVSARIITADGTTKIPIGKINDFLIKVNDIIILIKVLVMKTIQYQALVVPATCGHFKATNTTAPLIDFEEEKPKPIWEVYQVSWADKEHNKLLPILSWDDNGKGKQKRTKLTWNADQTWDTDHDLEELPNTPPQLLSYCRPKLICVNYSKKLLSMGTCCGDDEEYQMATKITSDNIEKQSNNRNNKAIASDNKTIENNPVKPKECIKASSCRRKDHFSYGKALFQYFRKDLGIPAGTTYTESDFCNYINAKIDCLLGHATDTRKLGEQIHQSLLRYLTATTTRAIAETLRIIDTDIKYYVAQRFPQVQQPVESDPEEYENKSNNPITAQAKSTVNKKPRVLSPTTPSYHQTLQSRIVFNPPLETQLETPQTPGNQHPWNQHSWTKSLEEYRSLFGNLTPAASQTEENLST